MVTAQATRHGVLRHFFVLVLAFAPDFAGQAAAQPAPPANSSFAALAARVQAGDTVSVRLTSGEAVAGTFVRASAVSLTLTAAGQAREFMENEVQQVVRARGANRLRRGVLIGVPLGASVGSRSGCFRVDTSGYMPGTDPPAPCGAFVAAGMAAGGGLGALIGRRVTRPAVVYSAPAAPPVPAEREGISVPPSVAPGPPAASTRSVPSLSSLSTRVIPFQTIYVRTRNGEDVAGAFSNASDERLRMEVGGRTWEIAAADVREVRLRGGNRAKRGGLIGLGAGAAIAGVMIAAGSRQSSDREASIAAVVAIGGAGVGAAWGAIIGAFVHERPLVYRSVTPSVRVTPMVAPQHVGMLASVRF